MDSVKRMRRAPTDAEHRLWERLRNQQAGFKFRRQHRVGGYIVDFICVERGLVVEVDGGQHADAVMRTQPERRICSRSGCA
jgi:lysyl-tRNA synthetase class 2